VRNDFFKKATGDGRITNFFQKVKDPKNSIEVAQITTLCCDFSLLYSRRRPIGWVYYFSWLCYLDRDVTLLVT
jgi:hypothetical protein